ncbi:hypothetical protein [Sphingomonas mesophila]|uniref:hypothetical protein n=1 Tax=Sphingomonas mesophila TaxID=2303576 RepID=UPI000E580425|nr:hypothetical protein [Sphingomonas mesophila]
MTADRFEWEGAGLALLLHAALIAALSLTLADLDEQPEAPAMEVDFVDEVALDSAAPQAVAAPSAPPPAPLEQAEPEPVAETPPPPTPRAVPQPAARPEPAPPRQAQRPQPPRPQQRPAPRPAPRPGLGDDFLAKLDDDLAPRPGAAKPAAASVSTSQMAGIVSVIRRKIQPCADRQINPGPDANKIVVRLRVQLLPNGRLRRAPQVLSTSGVTDDNARFEERVKDLAVASFVGCAPLSGLPPDLYDKGWSNFIMTYKLP